MDLQVVGVFFWNCCNGCSGNITDVVWCSAVVVAAVAVVVV